MVLLNGIHGESVKARIEIAVFQKRAHRRDFPYIRQPPLDKFYSKQVVHQSSSGGNYR